MCTTWYILRLICPQIKWLRQFVRPRKTCSLVKLNIHNLGMRRVTHSPVIGVRLNWTNAKLSSMSTEVLIQTYWHTTKCNLIIFPLRDYQKPCKGASNDEALIKPAILNGKQHTHGKKNAMKSQRCVFRQQNFAYIYCGNPMTPSSFQAIDLISCLKYYSTK